MKRLAIITTHPIQYNAPLFKMLAERKKLDIHVFYTWGQTEKQKFDPGFGKNIMWDIPLLEGYQYSFVDNTSKNPGSHHYKGIINPSLLADIENWRADAILIMGWNFKSHLAAMRYFKGKIPVLFRGDSTLLNKGKGIKEWLRTVYLKNIYRFIDVAFYTGIHNKSYFVKYGLKDYQLILAQHAIDNNRFTTNHYENKIEAYELRSNLKIAETDFVFLFAGKLDPIKNLDLLIAAFTKAKLLNAKLIIAGNGIMEKILKQMAQSNPDIVFLPFQNQQMMPKLYRLGQVFVLPSKSETWGLSINEAMCCRLAILASNTVGCAPELISDDNGMVFKSGNLEDLTDAIKKIANSYESVIKMGEASYQKIQSFTYLEICQEFENYFLKSINVN